MQLVCMYYYSHGGNLTFWCCRSWKCYCKTLLLEEEVGEQQDWVTWKLWSFTSLFGVTTTQKQTFTISTQTVEERLRQNTQVLVVILSGTLKRSPYIASVVATSSPFWNFYSCHFHNDRSHILHFVQMMLCLIDTRQLGSHSPSCDSIYLVAYLKFSSHQKPQQRGSNTPTLRFASIFPTT